ncbi:hypothetical protein Dxin01_00106 [Deinococcus xinjiangensis]|uniref:Uncharacterized protein n=1 Tax=Deinococcus xinjiangensis TaxID=457454 RepID=A0ABP9V524_9DEIO
MSTDLEKRGLSRDDIRRWFEVCYPVQVRLVMRDFKNLTVQEQCQVGINGARGLKPGVLKRRQEERQQLAMNRISEAKRLAHERTLRERQDYAGLSGEFL